MRRIALRYMTRHWSRLPVVMAARVGRELDLFEPIQQVDFEWQALARPRLPAFLGLGMYYAMVLLALPGVAILRRRGVTLLAFGTILIDTVLVCLVSRLPVSSQLHRGQWSDAEGVGGPLRG
jgi:hypothetical protein